MNVEELIDKLLFANKHTKLQITFDKEITFGLKRENVKGIVSIGDKAIIDYGQKETSIEVHNFLKLLYEIQDRDLEVGVLIQDNFVRIKEVLYLQWMFADMAIIEVY